MLNERPQIWRGTFQALMTKIGWFNFRNRPTSCIRFLSNPGATEERKHG